MNLYNILNKTMEVIAPPLLFTLGVCTGIIIVASKVEG